jgi:hypothetical protein
MHPCDSDVATRYPGLSRGVRDALADPIVQALLAADRVDPQEVADLARRVAARLSPANPTRAARAPEHGSNTDVSIGPNPRCDGGESMEKSIEAVMKQLAVKPRQTVNEIVTAIGLSKDEVIFALISLASPDREVVAVTAYSLAGNGSDVVSI